LSPRLTALEATFRSLAARVGIGVSACDGVAVSLPSLIDSRTGRILTEIGKYADAPRVDLRAWGKEKLGLPLAIENDARMALVGEWLHGAGRGSDDVVMMTLGTGLGTSAVIEGRVLRGKHGQAGCLGGHLTVRYGGHKSNCGNIGCAEAEASTAFLARVAGDHPGFRESPLSREPLLDYAAILRHAGDACAVAVLEHSIQVWGALAVSLIHAYDPEILILGSGIMAGGDVILPAIRDYVRRYANTPWGEVKIVKSQLGARAALMAAEWLVREQITAK
jgi:glucokinase